MHHSLSGRLGLGEALAPEWGTVSDPVWGLELAQELGMVLVPAWGMG